MSFQKDKLILRELAAALADIAALPVQEEKRALWRGLNSLRPGRPMVAIDQVCWNEMDIDDTLTLRCEDEELRGYESRMRRKLFQWKHFPGDMVVEPFVTVDKAIHNAGYGLSRREVVLATDPQNAIVAHRYEDILKDDDDLEAITVPVVTHDAVETERRMAVAREVFDGLLEVCAEGAALHLQLWDPISQYKGVENALFALADDPEFVHRIVARMVKSFIGMLDQLEEQCLLIEPRLQTLVHCTGAYTDELPTPGYVPGKARCRDLWIAGQAQMFSSVSAAMHKEFDIDYCRPIFERYGRVYYGCCEPLDRKLEVVTTIPNLRKVSMSPWTQTERGAEGLGRRFVFSCKPNPAHLAASSFDETVVRNELSGIKAACDRHGCPLEFILKDISTLKYEPGRLFRWAEIAMEVAGA